MRESTGTLSTPHEGSARLRFSHRLGRLDATPTLPEPALFEVSIALDDGDRTPAGAEAMLRAGARFLIDALHGDVDGDELARMIGCFAFAWAAGEGHGVVDVRLASDRGPSAVVRVRRPAFGLDTNGFGAAHILHEKQALGLYILEVAPGAAIPAHFHRAMQETELMLEAGLLQQGRPVTPGDAFVWPVGWVHEYANPTGVAKRLLCLDRPKFIPEDEVVVAGPAELVPIQPVRNYLA